MPNWAIMSMSCPYEIDTEIAKIKLASMGYAIDTLSEEQRKYLNLD